MHNKKRGIEKLFGFIIIFMPLLVIPTILFGGEADNKPERNSESQADYILMVKENFISLKAKDASIKEILEDIGCRMKIEVLADIPIEERNPEEVTHCGGKRVAPEKIKVYNPAFDVTPNKFIDAIITEKGILRKPFKESIKRILK